MTSSEASARIRLLVVDDDDLQRVLLQEILEREGYAVALASNGKEALDLVDIFRPHLVATDIVMPVMGGVALRRELRRRPQSARLPFLFFTAHADHLPTAHSDEALEQYMTKPLDLDELLLRIKAMV